MAVTKDELKGKVSEEIDRRRDELHTIAKTIARNPELGFKEFKTAKLVTDTLSNYDIPYQSGLGITGVSALLRGGNPGPTIGIFGELDALGVTGHPLEDPQTGAAHACGHNAQIATIMAIAAAFKSSKALDSLSGNLKILAVPAEEYVDIEYRYGLKKQGKLEYLGGKPEFIKLGVMDDVNLALMVHTSSRPEGKKASITAGNNGCVVKLIEFIGKAAHAGGAPDKGVNALNAAMLALSGIHYQRETFRDDDSIRVHPIITKGGDVVNVVPSQVKLETFVRGKTTEAVEDANMKVDRALRAGALAIGAKVNIITLPGYLPLSNNAELAEIYKENVCTLVGYDNFAHLGYSTGSTDMGDISQIMPAIHPYAGGAVGASHGKDYEIVDYDLSVLTPAKSIAMSVIDLLWDDAAKAREIITTSKPRMTKQEYLSFMSKLNREELYEG